MAVFEVSFFDKYLESGYVHFHKPRFIKLLNTFFAKYQEGDDVLDIGSSVLTKALRSKIQKVDTLGFSADSEDSHGNNYYFDLNESREKILWRKDIPQYDKIVFCEVIEHLYTSPSQVLSFINSCLKPNGHVFIQTPNAVALNKRLKMILGKNPFELIREDYKNPGHFREYTAAELVTYLKKAGFDIEHLSFENYFDFEYSDHIGDVVKRDKKRRFLNMLYQCLPGSLKPGLFIVAKKSS